MREVIVFGLDDAIGGVEIYTLTMQKLLRDDLRFLYIMEMPQNMHADAIRQMGGEVYFIPKQNGLTAYIRNNRRKLTEFRKRTDVLYLNLSNYSREMLYVFHLARKLKYRVVVHSHGAMLKTIESPLHRFTHKIVKRVSLHYIRFFTRVAVSQRAGVFMYGNRTFDILPAGIDLARFVFSPADRAEVRKQWHCEDKAVLGFVGRLAEVKNVDFIIRVMKELKEIAVSEKPILMIVGGGPLEEDLRKLTDELGLQEDVIFTGFTDQVPKYLQAMDCLIGASFSEGMPLGFMEAQAAGLPCICAEGRYPQEIAATDLVRMIPLEAGERAWAEAIGEIMRTPGLEEKRMAFQAETALKQFDQGYIAQRLLQILCGTEK